MAQPIYTAIAPSVQMPVIQKKITWDKLQGRLANPSIGPKQGSGYVAAKIGDGPRKNERVEFVSLLVYDIDNKSSTITEDELECAIKRQGYRALFHSTYSHTLSAPRFRLVLDISEGIPPAEHKDILLRVAATLGIEECIDKSATDPSRFFFRPRCPADQLDNFVFCQIEGEPVDVTAFQHEKALCQTPENHLLAQFDQATRNLIGQRSWVETDENVALVEGMLAHVSPDCDRATWISAIWSVMSLDWAIGEALAADWSKQSERHWGEEGDAADAKQDLAQVIADYDPAAGITLGSLWHHAIENGWQYQETEKVVASIEQHDASEAAPKFKLLSPSDLDALKPMDWLVKDLLPTEGVAAIYGAPGSGKTFLALDLAMAVSEGLNSWFGRPLKQRPVVYLALEGRAGIHRRIKGWEIHNKRTADNIKIVIDDFDLRRQPDVTLLADAIEQEVGTQCVVFIDTLNQASPGADENSSVDMGRIVSAAKTISNSLEALVNLVHHSGKNAQNGLRGHSSLNGAMDTVMLVQKQKTGGHSWSIDKVKDADGSAAESFDLVVHNVGTDGDGLPETSCAVEPNGGAPSQVQQCVERTRSPCMRRWRRIWPQPAHARMPMRSRLPRRRWLALIPKAEQAG